MAIEIQDIQIYAVDIKTRMPFRYGIATLTEVPYVIVAADAVIDGTPARGLAADVLPPKWFTKVPDAAIDAELREMAEVIGQAVRFAKGVRVQESVFDFQQAVHALQDEWGTAEELPPLLSGFGTSLVERAVIDAFCRAKQTTFAAALRSNAFGVRLDALHTELAGKTPADFLPKSVRALRLRHTVGLLDPLSDGDIADADRLDDGLPQSLEACIRHYGLTYFKIKLPSDFGDAQKRLKEVARIVTANCKDFAFTLDGNEAFREVGSLRECLELLDANPVCGKFLQSGLLLVEQPLHRDIALGDAAKKALLAWDDRPPIIIDESDGTVDTLPRALDCGYAGTSHKNCKGVFHGVASACLLEHHRRRDKTRTYLLTGEDLMNVGPIAMLQDLAVSATLGVEHIERNGHHFVKGLSAFPQPIQESVLDWHPDLYRRVEDFATLKVTEGTLSTDSVLAAPFGYANEMDLGLLRKFPI